MHLFARKNCTDAWRPHKYRVGGFFEGEKKPAQWRAWSDREGLAGVHAPPEDVTEDADLLLLDLLEAVVLVRVLVAVEAAQANPGGQAIQLLHSQLAVVVDGVEVAIDDVADRAFAGIDPDRGPIAQHRQHAVAPHRDALGLIELHAVVPQAALAEAQAGALAFLDDESS